MIKRAIHLRSARRLLSRFPVVGLLGARQVGKTTLAESLASSIGGPVTRFDLEGPGSVARLADPMLTLGPLKGVVIRGQRRIRLWIKKTTPPAITPSMHTAIGDLKRTEFHVVHAKNATFRLSREIQAAALQDLPGAIKPLRVGCD